MSETSPQLSQLLLPAGLQSAQQGLPAGGLRPAAAGPADTAFQAQLQAVLRGDSALSRAAPLAPGGTAGRLGNGLVDGLGEPALTDVEQSGAAIALTGGGNALPESGKILPPLTAPADASPLPDANRAVAAAAGGTLSSGREVLAARLNAAPTDAARQVATAADADPQAGVTTDTISELTTRSSRSNDSAQSGIARDAELRAPTVAAQTAASPQVADIIRRVQSLPGGRERATIDGDARLQEFTDLTARQPNVARVTAAADSSAAQFNLHARPDGLLTPAMPTSAESALRDLASMTPLRPQTGDASGTWANGLGQRLLMMAENGVETARVRLNPANLGPLDIQVNVEEDRAQVWFGAQNGTTRDALESALPRLREMFAEQGLQLTDAEVGERANSESGGEDQAAGAGTTLAEASLSRADEVAVDGAAAAQYWGVADNTSLDIYV